MTFHAIAGSQGTRAFCRCGQAFQEETVTQSLVLLMDHIEAEGGDPGADPWPELRTPS